VLVDANILLYSIDEDSPFHRGARDWMVAALNGPARGIPWVSLWAFVGIATNHRASAQPLTPDEAWQHVEAWLDAPATWIPEPGLGHRAIVAP
jgi:uncharacterized protein